MKEGRIRGALIISAHLIRITGRDHGARPGMPTAAAREKSAENSQTGAGDDEEGQIKARLFFMSPRGPSRAPPHTRSLLTGGCFALRNLNVRSIQEIKRKEEVWEPTMGKTGLFSWANRRLYS